MTGACIIDGVDIYTLGAFICRGGDNDFISLPARKDPAENDWPELDGAEVDNNDPVFAAKKVTVKYYLKGDQLTFVSRLSDFMALHNQSGNRSVYIREFDKTFLMRFIEVSGYSQKHGFSSSGDKSTYIDVVYSMDDPLQFLSPLIILPEGWRPSDTLVTVNGVDLAEFGIIVNDIYSSALKFGTREGIITESQYRSGLTADVGLTPKRKKQPIKIVCTMICSDRDEFLHNYSALWNLISSGVISVHLPAIDLQCYYSTMSSFEKRPWSTGRAQAKFTLDLYANVYEPI
jgi:hypothetical protein